MRVWVLPAIGVGRDRRRKSPLWPAAVEPSAVQHWPGPDDSLRARAAEGSPQAARRFAGGADGPVAAPPDRDRRYRIVMVAACPFPAPRGTPIRIFHMASELARRGHDLDLVTYHLGQEVDNPPFRIRRIANVPTYRKWSPGPNGQKLLLLDPLLALRLIGILRTRRYDIIHAHHVEGLLTSLPARRYFGVPVVFDVHTTMESELPFYSQRGRSLLQRFGRVLDARLPAWADHVIAVSEEIRAKMTAEHGLATDRVSVIPNGVEESFFTAAGEAADAPAGPGPSLVFAGNLAPYQGIDLLLAAFAGALRQRSDLRLRIVTEGGFDAYETLAAELGVRECIDLVAADLTELPRELAAASVLLNPRTEGDGAPQKILNYMAAGRPIVSFAGTARHLVHGQDALIVPNGDVQAFSEAILSVCSNPALARRLGEHARSTARSELSWARTAARVERVYANLAPALRRER